MEIRNLLKSKYIKKFLEYILCLLILEVLIVVINIILISKNPQSNVNVVSTEISKINGINDEISANNYKLEVLKCDKSSYFIKVNYKMQNVIIYAKDENGDYTIPVKTMICSTGVSTPTEGVYEISDKYEWASLVGNVYGQYATRITGPILFHSVPYTKKDKSTLEYWEYDLLGQYASKGCVRLTVEDAKWIFDNCARGTKVEFYESDNQINTSKINLRKISDYDEKLRGWDPTDPDPENPWIEYDKQNKGEDN